MPVTVVYWMGMFVGTHWPQPPRAAFGVTDKWLHVGAFCGLAFLLSAASSVSRATTGVRYLRIFSVLVIYAALDELTQVPVGRDCEWLDFCADFAGAAAGIALFVAATALARWGYGAAEGFRSQS